MNKHFKTLFTFRICLPAVNMHINTAQFRKKKFKTIINSSIPAVVLLSTVTLKINEYVFVSKLLSTNKFARE